MFQTWYLPVYIPNWLCRLQYEQASSPELSQYHMIFIIFHCHRPSTNLYPHTNQDWSLITFTLLVIFLYNFLLLNLSCQNFISTCIHLGIYLCIRTATEMIWFSLRLSQIFSQQDKFCFYLHFWIFDHLEFFISIFFKILLFS